MDSVPAALPASLALASCSLPLAWRHWVGVAHIQGGIATCTAETLLPQHPRTLCCNPAPHTPRTRNLAGVLLPLHGWPRGPGGHGREDVALRLPAALPREELGDAARTL
eukprot:365111-Chlamydomonas_euryale.AAC.14